MIGVRRAGIAGGLILMVGLLWLACGGGPQGGPKASPKVLQASCGPVGEFERFRYTYSYLLDSPKPKRPVDDELVGSPPFAVPPNSEDFRLKQVYDGSFVAPDGYLINVESPSEEKAGSLQLLYLGDQALANYGTGWVTGQVPNAFPPMHVCESLVGGLDVKGMPYLEEEVNGEKTLHYTIRGAKLQAATRLFGPQSDMGRLLKRYDVETWLAEDGGWPVKTVARSEAAYPSGRKLRMELTLEIKDINSSDIKIELPEE
ncbi:MAG: hypothetical protein HYS09_05240 [Chloroflexi bacterium]|nr:hypothetical protein [Chloroflexota bacterium]